MKKLISLALMLVICSSTVSCGIISDISLMDHTLALADEAKSVNYYTDYYKDEEYKTFLAKLEGFSARLSEKLCAELSE